MSALSLALLLATGCVGSVEETIDEFPMRPAADAGTEESATYQEYEAQDCSEGRPRPHASGLRIRALALYQTIKLPLYRDGVWLEKLPAPIVRGKRALVRVFVEPLEGYEPHDVYAVLRIDAGKEVRELADQRRITEVSTDGKKVSTFNIEIPGELITERTTLSVTLEEPSCDAAGGSADDARVPVTDQRALTTTGIGTLRVALVPLTIGGRLPALTPDALAGLRRTLAAFYPVPDVAISVRAPLDPRATGDIRSDLAVWQRLLAFTRTQRTRDAAADDVYYVAVFQPGASRKAYCADAPTCMLGAAPHLKKVAHDNQVAAVAFFADEKSYESVAHELGHAHGLAHAQCAVPADSPDPNFPSPTGDTDTWGWDPRSGNLMPPSYKDLMSYCNPYWVGAYHYRALAARADDINVSALMIDTRRGGFRDLLWQADGSVRWASDAPVSGLAGERERATVLDAAGNLVTAIELGVVPISHTRGAILYLPEPGPSWSTIVWSGGRLRLARILPPY